jgi:transcription factor SPN1
MEALQKKKRQEVAAAAQRKKRAKNLDDDKPRLDKDKEKGYDSGDSYDSAAFQRTKEDDDFIDREGDDEDAINELYAEQHFDDERPEDDEPIKKKSGGSSRRGKGPDAVSDDEDGEPSNPIMAAVHKMKKKKRIAKKQSEIEDEIKDFLARMDNAAEDDEDAIKGKRPATRKLTMLDEVVDMLMRRDIMRTLLDFDVLASCKKWIQPLPTGKLGNVTVRQRIVEAISKMTGDFGITSSDLKRSGLGQVVMVLYKHKDETPTMKRDLKKLIEQWSRPIFQKSDDMRSLEHVHATRRDPPGLSAIAAMRATPSLAKKDDDDKQDLQSLIASGKKGGQKEGLNRVRVPFSKGFQYTVRPENKSVDVSDTRMIRPGQQKDTRGNLSKRMIEKGRAGGKNQRSANISIEGRPVK